MNLPIVQNKTGWPWTQISSPDSSCSHDQVSDWPKVSIVTPSYNQGQYLEETIRSVLLQNYPKLEYIIIDGGSTDNSVEIIKKYEPWISYWVSEKDRGQTHAINKGFGLSTGEILAWLNSDDTYLPNAISTAVTTLIHNPASSFVYGHALFTDPEGQTIQEYSATPLASGYKRMKYWKGWRVPQPTLFFKKQLIDQYGALNERLNYAMDYEWIIRISQGASSVCIDQPIATYRRHPASKTGDFQQNKKHFYKETLRTNLLYAPPYKPSTWPLWLSWQFYILPPFLKKIINKLIPCRK